MTHKYTDDPKFYREKLLRLEKEPGVNEKKSCYVLYAAGMYIADEKCILIIIYIIQELLLNKYTAFTGTYDSVQLYLNAKTRRFHIPNSKAKDDEPDTSIEQDPPLNNSSDTENAEVSPELAKAKARRKVMYTQKNILSNLPLTSIGFYAISCL